MTKVNFNDFNRKGVTKNVHEIVFWQSISMVGGMER